MRKSLFFGVALAFLVAESMAVAFPRLPNGPRKWARGFGAGCPSGTVQYVESTDGQTISVLFDSFQVESGKPNGPVLPGVQCDLSLPFQVPAGQKLRSVQLDYRGFASIPKRGQMVTLTSAHKVQGRKGRMQIDQDTDSIQGPKSGEFTFSQKLREGWTSECGETVDFNAKVILRAFSMPRIQEVVTASLDSLDAQASLTYKLQFVPCNTGPGPGPGPGPKPPRPPGHRDR